MSKTKTTKEVRYVVEARSPGCAWSWCGWQMNGDTTKAEARKTLTFAKSQKPSREYRIVRVTTVTTREVVR